MANPDDDAARSTTDPDGAPRVETEDAEPGVWPAAKGEREVGPHDDTKPFPDDTDPANPRPVPGTEQAKEA